MMAGYNVYPPQLSHIISNAVTRLHTEIKLAAPFMARQVIPWIKHLAGAHLPASYFTHPLAFPSLLLPWWVEKPLAPAPTAALQADLAYSTINGYYHIRLIDNLMDGHATVERQLLPALNFFHTQFQSSYRPYFDHSHPFWPLFNAVWFRSAEAAMQDAGLTTIDRHQFEQIAAQKVCAAKIPAAAVCYYHNRPNSIEPWSDFIDRFGGWHQFYNDLFDWHKDLTNHTPTYFLSEANRHKRANESILGWVARRGFAWGVHTLQTQMVDLKTLAQNLHSPDAVNYLNASQSMLLHPNDKLAQ